MQEELLSRIYDESAERVREADGTFHRYLYHRADWGVRVLALNGPRGVGKTTMFLQYLKEQNLGEKALYVSLDDIWIDALELFELVKHHVQHGGTHVFIDEVHYFKDWHRLVKNLTDSFKDLKIAYTGSSILRMKDGSADLSRRQIDYTLRGLSFREYLELEGVLSHEPVEFEELLRDHVRIAESITRKIKVIPLFERYLINGYYPFYREDLKHYARKLQQIINQVLERDIPLVADITPETIRKTRKMLSILASSTPQTPKVAQLCRDLDMDRKQGIKVLYALKDAGLMGLLAEDAESLKYLGAPNKIYCDNTNLMYVLSSKPDTGTLRETFFNNQVGAVRLLSYPKQGDFKVDDRWSFEIGGAHKTFAQIKDLPDSYLAVAETEVGRGAKIPLWLFGFLY